LSEDKEIIASSNPKKVGTIVNKKSGTNFLIKAELGTKAPDEKLKEINIPIIVGDEKYGYVDVISIWIHLQIFNRNILI